MTVLPLMLDYYNDNDPAAAEWIAARRREGHTLRQIADALGISAPHAWKISKAADSSPPQNEG